MDKTVCRVILMSGFLGSGKTTMLRHLLDNAPADKKLFVLMNEFGRIGVDGDVIKALGVDIIEISRGSIFCACAKGDYLRALGTIARDYSPDVLIMEASGVADTRDIKKDIQMAGGFFKLEENVCVVDAEHFTDWLDVFVATELQVRAASLIVINKTDTVSPEALARLREVISGLNDSAPLLETSFGRIGFSELLRDEDTAPAAAIPDDDEWERLISAALSDEKSHMKTPDSFAASSIVWSGDAGVFRDILKKIPRHVVRAKGYHKVGDGEWELFDVVGGCVSYSPFEGCEAEHNLALFISEGDANVQEIPKMMLASGLKIGAIKS